MTLKEFEVINSSLKTYYLIKNNDGSFEGFYVDYTLDDDPTLYKQINYRSKFNDFIVESCGVSEISGEFVVVIKEGNKNDT